MDNLLEVENVSISFIQYTKGLNQRDLKVITDLTLDISEGEILAVLGSSGSGKSLLAHAIFGILPGNANLNGKIKFKGKELSQEDKEEIRGKNIVLVPQSVNFLDPLIRKRKSDRGKYLNTTTWVLKWMTCIHSSSLEVWHEEFLFQPHCLPIQIL